MQLCCVCCYDDGTCVTGYGRPQRGSPVLDVHDGGKWATRYHSGQFEQLLPSLLLCFWDAAVVRRPRSGLWGQPSGEAVTAAWILRSRRNRGHVNLKRNAVLLFVYMGPSESMLSGERHIFRDKTVILNEMNSITRDGHTHTYIHAHTHTHKHKDTHAHPHTRVHTCAHTHTGSQPHTCKHRRTHTNTYPHVHRNIHTHTPTHARIHAHTHTHTKPHTRKHTNPHIYTKTYTRTHTLIHAHSCAHTHSRTQPHTQTHTRTQTHLHINIHARLHTNTHTAKEWRLEVDYLCRLFCSCRFKLFLDVFTHFCFCGFKNYIRWYIFSIVSLLCFILNIFPKLRLQYSLYRSTENYIHLATNLLLTRTGTW